MTGREERNFCKSYAVFSANGSNAGSYTKEEPNYMSQRFFINRYDKKQVKSPTKIKYIHSREKFDILPPSNRIALIGS